jgi:predicted DCC family thiol-disulfide oxidoreductase YuxK
VQSEEGKAILLWYGLPTDYYETMLLVEGAVMYQKSTAFIRVM